MAREPLFTHHLRSPAKIHSTQSGTFLLLTNKGSIHCITEQVSENDPPTFHHKVHLQLPMPCAKMLSTVISIDSTEYLIVVADNGGSLAAWRSERVINIAIPPLTSSLTSVTGERSHHSLLLHLQDHSLVSCRVNLDSSIRLTTFTQVDRFALRTNRLVTLNNKTNHLDLVDLHSSTSHTRIQLENHCEHLCLNESGRCVFALVSPRVLYMYRFTDGRPVTKLFLNDLVCAMRADDDFLVLAMVDRRLLTLMIADPDDPTVSEKIRALPSR